MSDSATPVHWTYVPFKTESSLEQGDFLEPSFELNSVLKDFPANPSFESINGFLVLTQSCDLVRAHNRKLKTQYISLAIVQPLMVVLPNMLQLECKRVSNENNFFLSSSKEKAHELLSRVLNQNERKQGLFFLHEDEALGLGVHSVAMLRASITLDARRYDVLQKARKGRLKPEFQAKLGWLVGNLYSRVGTADWADQDQGGKLLKKLIRDILSGSDSSPRWISDEIVKCAEAEGVQNITELSELEIEKYRPTPPKELATQVISELLNKLAVETSLYKHVPEEDMKRFQHKLKRRIMIDPRFLRLLKG